MTVNAVIKAFTSATGRVIVFCDTKSDCDELVTPPLALTYLHPRPHLHHPLPHSHSRSRPHLHPSPNPANPQPTPEP